MHKRKAAESGSRALCLLTGSESNLIMAGISMTGIRTGSKAFEEQAFMKKSRNNRKKRKNRPAGRQSRPVSIPRMILGDLLLTAGILLLFSLFHHVIPQVNSEPAPSPVPIAARLSESTPVPESTPAPEAAPEPAETPLSAPEPTEAPEPPDWRTKFSDFFTEEVQVTDHSYTSPGVAIDIQQYKTRDEEPSTYFVADIHIAELESFQTRWAGGSLVYSRHADPQKMSRETEAILSINGDYANLQETGILVRNGEFYMDGKPLCDICVLYDDGVMETYSPEEYEVEEVLERMPWQIWKFGPALLDGEGQPRASFNTTGPISGENPRTGIGYYEPGHYCFVVVDGRQGDYSVGMTMGRFARLFSELGCTAAYNLDGGRSSVMYFQQERVSHPFLNGRSAGDILLIREVEPEEEKK